MASAKTDAIVLSIVATALLVVQVYGQTSSLDDLPQPDWNFTLGQKFFKTNEFVFVFTDVEDAATYEEICERCQRPPMPNVRAVAKHEDDLTEADYRQHMLVCGPVDTFEKWDTFDLPIERIEGGFRLGPRAFTDANDGIYFMSSDGTRITYTGNSLGPIDGLLRTICGLYQYTIVQNSVPVHFGNLVNDRFDARSHIDLSEQRGRHLDRTLTSRHFVFHYSDRMADAEKLEAKAAAFDEYCDDAIAHLELGEPDYRIHCYVYAEEKEKFLLSGTPGAGGITYGKEIHTLALEPVEHESLHVLFNSGVAQPKNNFFNEGIRQYYEYVTDPMSLAEGRRTVRKYLNKPIGKWADGSIHFFATPLEDRWPVAYPASGLFVMYLIERRGLAKFKEFYATNDVGTGFLEVYEQPLSDAVRQWKETVRE